MPGAPVVQTIPGFTLRAVFEALRVAIGSSFTSLLAEAGLSRFVDQPPPDSPVPVATEHELSKFYSVVFLRLGEPIFRIFMTNFGRAIVQDLRNQLIWKKAIETAQATPQSTRLKVAVEQTAKAASQVYSQLTASERADGFHLTLAHCPTCADIRGAKGPICEGTATIHCGMLIRMTATSLRVVEVECCATGGKHCDYLVITQ